MDDVPVPEIGPNEVLIKTKKTSICGTDLHIYKWDEWARKTIPVPMVVGHEFVGTVAKIGKNVTNVKEGDRVTVVKATSPAETASNAAQAEDIYVPTPKV